MPGETAAPVARRRWVLIYDHDCGTCRVAAALVLCADRRRSLMPVALQDARIAVFLAPVPRGRWARSWHLAAPGGRVYSGGAAIPELCRLLPGFGVPGLLCGAAPDVTERVYAGLARNRRHIGPRIPGRLVGWATGILDGRSGRA
jgi:predicted DCC family thiol-disulfide oxidoreductase YuxK